MQLSAHGAAIAGSGAAYAYSLQAAAPAIVISGALIGDGFTLVTMFAAMHECVHRTASRAGD